MVIAVITKLTTDWITTLVSGLSWLTPCSIEKIVRIGDEEVEEERGKNTVSDNEISN